MHDDEHDPFVFFLSLLYMNTNCMPDIIPSETSLYSHLPSLSSFIPSKHTWLKGYNCIVALAVFGNMVTTKDPVNYYEQLFDVFAHASYLFLPENSSPAVIKFYNTLESIRLTRIALSPVIGSSIPNGVLAVDAGNHVMNLGLLNH